MNTELFLLINASKQASELVIYFAIFCASYLVYLPIIIMVMGWFSRPTYRPLIIKMVFGLGVALVVSFLIRHLVYSPRPFVVDIGTNYLPHDPTSSLPSQHAVFVWTLCLTLYFNYKKQIKKLFWAFVIVAMLVCWSRIYLGIHWPLDIVAGFIVSLVSTFIIHKMRFRYFVRN